MAACSVADTPGLVLGIVSPPALVCPIHLAGIDDRRSEPIGVTGAHFGPPAVGLAAMSGGLACGELIESSMLTTSVGLGGACTTEWGAYLGRCQPRWQRLFWG
jgi:hypothetical protein